MFLPNEEKTYLFLPTDSWVSEPIVGCYPLDSLEVVDIDGDGMTKFAMSAMFIEVGQNSVRRVMSPLTDMTMSLALLPTPIRPIRPYAHTVPIRVVPIMVIA